jgi:3-(3-hydroxy-phenyl)propionate hydroxylase
MIPGLVAGLIARATPGAGSILPQPMVRASGFSGQLDDLSSRTVRVVVCDAITANEGTALLEALVPLQGVLIQLNAEASLPARATAQTLWATEEEPLVAPWLKSLNRRFAIVRPDHYVYGTAETADDAVQLLRQMRQALH